MAAISCLGLDKAIIKSAQTFWRIEMKRAIKKIVTTHVVLAGLIITLLSGCGGLSGGSSGALELVIWHDKEAEVAAVLQERLDELKPEIAVTMERKSGLTNALQLVGNDASTAPDMYFFAHDKVGVYSEMGILAPITDFVSKEQLDIFLPMTIDAVTYKGNIYQLPIYFETLLFMYNRDLLADEDVPVTTEELYSLMVEHTVDGNFGFVEQYTNAYFAAGWLHGFGGGIITDDGVPMLDDENTMAALNYHRKFVEMMPGEGEFATINTLFREGRAMATIGGPWLVPSVRESGIDLGFAKMPVVNSTGLPIAPYSGVQGLHVLRVAAEQPQRHAAIEKVLNLLLSEEIGVAMAKASGAAPAYAAAYDLDEIKQNEMVMMMRETAKNAVPMPNIPEMDVMWNVASDFLVDIHMRGVSVEEAAQAAQQRALDLIDAMR